MRLITPERILQWIGTAESEGETAITNPAGTNQVLVVNALELVASPTAVAGGDELTQGTFAIGLTGDPATTDFKAFGSTDGQDSDQGDNLGVGELDYHWISDFTTSGQAVFVPQWKAYSWRGLSFDRRPLTNQDLAAFLVEEASAQDLDLVAKISYQLAELEPEDLGRFGGFLAVGAAFVRGPQIPSGGVMGPAGVVACSYG